jgi:hypothetical protein
MNRSQKTNRPESEDKRTGVERQIDRSQKTNRPESKDKSTGLAFSDGRFLCVSGGAVS